MNWETVLHIKRTFDIPLVLKGIQRADDALRAIDAGVDVIYVSNHGGRQLDHSRGCLDVLREVTKVVQDRVPVVVAGGFLRGADVIKGLCYGATAIGMGRLLGLAMAAGGPSTVVRALEILEQIYFTRHCVAIGLNPFGLLESTPTPTDLEGLIN